MDEMLETARTIIAALLLAFLITGFYVGSRVFLTLL